jgi:hypothetical protein
MMLPLPPATSRPEKELSAKKKPEEGGALNRHREAQIVVKGRLKEPP